MSDKRFRVALSFPGEKRDYVKKIADLLAKRFGEEAILYDHFHTAEFARPNLGFSLPKLYHKDSDLIVVVLCAEYETKEWCRLEWRAIYDVIKKRRDEDVMFFRADDAEIGGLYSLDGYAPVDAFAPEQAASLILQRLARNEGKPRDSYLDATKAPTAPSRLLPKWLRVTSAMVLLALISCAVFVAVSRRQPAAAFRILVAELDGPEGYGVTESLIEKLRKETRNHNEVAIIPLSKKISAQGGSELAEKLRADQNCDLVIWGWYRKTAGSVSMTLHFELKKQEIRTVLASDGVTRIYSAGQLDSFVIQQELSSEVSSLALFLVAHAQMQRGDYTKALKILDQVIEKTTASSRLFGHAEALLARSNCYHALGSNCTVLVGELSKALALNTNLFDAYVNRANAYSRCGLLNESIADCDAALRLSPGHGIPLITKATTLSRKGDFVGALRWADEAVKRDPSFAPYVASRARMLRDVGKSKEAVLECSRILQRKPDMAFALVVRGEAYTDIGEFDKAIADLTKARASPDFKSLALIDRGIAYTRKEDYWRAVDDYNEAESITPDHPLIYENRASLHLRLGKPGLALKDLNRWIQFKPDECEAYFRRAHAHWFLNDHDSADKDFSSAVSCNTNYAAAFEDRGLLALERGQYTNAIDYFSMVIRLNPNATNAFRSRAFAYLQIGENTNSISDWSRFIESNSTDPVAFIFRAAAYIQLEDFASATKDLETAKTFINDAKIVQQATQLLEFTVWQAEQTSLGDAAMVGLGWTEGVSGDRGTTNFGAGFLVRGKKALYLVTAASVARRMNRDAFVDLRGASNGISRISLNDLAARELFSEPLALWLSHPYADCAVSPLLYAKGETTEKVRNAVTIQLEHLEFSTNTLRVNSSVVINGAPTTTSSPRLFSPLKKITKTASGMLTDTNGSRHFLLTDTCPKGYAGGPVFESVGGRIVVQTNGVQVTTIKASVSLWGLVSTNELDSTGVERARVVHIAHAFEMIKDFEERLILVPSAPVIQSK